MSEHTLDGLIAKVKSEAIDKAEKEAKRIIDDAEAESARIRQNAEAEKSQIIEAAHAESEAILDKGKTALHQAARDVQISVKNDLIKLFKSVLETEVTNAFTPQVYTKVISKVIETLGNKVDIALPKETEDELLAALQKKLAKSDNTVNILRKEQLLSGLSVTKTNEGWSYDITAEEIADLLSENLSQKWLELLNND